MVSGGYGTPSAKISLETIIQRFTVFLQIIHACNNAVERRFCTCAFWRKQFVCQQIAKSSSKIPSYCRESLRFAKSSVLSTVAKPFPARSARCRAIRASADLPNGCMGSPDIIGSVLFHTPAVPRAPTCPKPLRRVTKISIFAPLSELDLQPALIFRYNNFIRVVGGKKKWSCITISPNRFHCF